MTEMTTTAEQPVVDVQEVSGVDLARVALHQAREAAKKRGNSQTRTPRRLRQRAVQRDGREPAGFGTVLHGLLGDRAWELPATGATVVNRWPDIAACIAPQLPDHVQAVAFDPETGQLDLRPDSPAYATQLRLISARIVAAANHAAGTQTVRAIRVLAVGQPSVPDPRTAAPAPRAAGGSEAPVKTRDMAPDGFHRALAAHQAVPRTREVTLDIAEAAARQTRVLRELSNRAFLDPE
ncbi:DciA family protein [Streptomyces spororaveus]|uniref:Nucleic acid-binding Zn ribbon protein n=1 Tax=Streptomyces spororaveus TaxID=284039 RepID=A0ABQ3T2G5_9ACTN|nr:DciA family protein [Streptomyces spororaveus]GHI74576.1 hypothetical protein Sspor_01370 [Streptomyces spororaveus]